MSTVRKATATDINGICRIYDRIHDSEERGETTTGWQRGIYPERNTAEAALARGDLYVIEDGGRLVGTGILNDMQVDVYKDGHWNSDAAENEVFVMHTLVIDTECAHKGYGRDFERYYEQTAIALGRPYLRIDTNEKNLRARAFYKKLGYTEIGIVPCTFNGIPGVNLVLMEKTAEGEA